MMSMSSLVLLLGLVVVVTARLEVPKIQILKQKTKTLSEQNPRNGPLCFSMYIPKLEGYSTTYELEYTKCNQVYDESTSLENEKWQGPKSQMEIQGGNSCRAISDCSSIVGYVEAFECFAQMGSDQSKAMYTLSADAINVAVEVQEYYRMIDTTKTLCINNAERNYVEGTAETYEQLNSCLSGNIPPNPTTYPTTRYPTTTTEDRVVWETTPWDGTK